MPPAAGQRAACGTRGAGRPPGAAHPIARALAGKRRAPEARRWAGQGGTAVHAGGDQQNGAQQSTATRGVVVLPGLGNSSEDYTDFVEDLTAMGMCVAVPQVRRVDWLRNAAGVVDSAYWAGSLKPRPTVDWYLQRLGEAIDQVKRDVDGAPITIVAHSAGGWLGRVYLKDFGTAGIDSFISLGSPHSPPPEGAEGVVDQTRGILNYCSEECPGAFHPEVNYVTVAGRYIQGARFNGEGTFQQKLVGLGYQQVCGQADVWGDGVVPLPAAHLDGATNIDLEGVYHSPVGAKRSLEDSEEGEEGRLWYGSQGVLERWSGYLLSGGRGAEASAQARS